MTPHKPSARLLSATLCLAALLPARAQTLEQCHEAAERNYPLIKRYALAEQTAGLTVANIEKGWLPQVSAYAQGTVQNRVVTLPEAMTRLMTSQGMQVDGLAKTQYKIGVDVAKTLYDGGRMRGQKAVARRRQTVDEAQNRVGLYAVRQRVDDLYFGLLLLDDKRQLNLDLQRLLTSSERQLAAMVRAGTAATSDLNAVRAERIGARQQAVELETQQAALRQMLALFTGLDIGSLSRPEAGTAAGTPDAADCHRPELLLTEARLSLLDARLRALDTQLRPALAAFAQGYYGYPGLDMYRDIMRRTPSLNALVGVKLSWNIGALYTRRNDRARLGLERQTAENDRELFLFNNRLEVTRQQADIDKYRRLQEQDDEIIRLRTDVRRAAESKLAHGIIDVNNLVREINAENQARLQRSIHELEMLREIYRLRHTLNP